MDLFYPIPFFPLKQNQMNFSENTKVGQVVAEDYRLSDVFYKYEVDFSCQGEKTLKQIAEEKELNIESLLGEIEENTKNISPEESRFKDFPLDELADYIVKTHHKYTEEQVQKLKPLLAKLLEKEVENHPELNQIDELFKQVAGEMASHMKKEEIILFPFIKKVVKAQNEGVQLEASFSRIENPVNMMIHDHTDQGETFREIAKLTNNYTPPKNAHKNFETAYSLLKDLEKDLHKHIHLENNILFPKALELSREWIIPSH